jgi:hypothetical protein
MLGLAVPLLAAAGRAEATIATFDFGTQTFGMDTPFSMTDSGVTANFSSPAADPGGFAITSSFGLTSNFTGDLLYSPGSALIDTVPLTIAFSEVVHSISLVFSLGAFDPNAAIELATNAGGTASVTGSIAPGGLFPEGILTFVGDFTELTLTSTALDFGVADISVEVPEPATTSLFGLGLLGMAGLRRAARTPA